MGTERNIYLVRHGELYEESGIHRCLGRTDVPLTDRGRRQAQKTAAWFRDRSAGAIYSSPLLRCVKTAQAIEKQYKDAGREINIVTLAALREMDAGKWENLSFEEIRERYPAEYEARGKQLGTYAPPGGESFCQAGERLSGVLDEILTETTGGIIVVAHAGLMRGYLSRLLGMSPDDVFSIPQPYGGITILKEQDGKIRAEKIGWKPAAFLDEEEIRYFYRKCSTPEPVIRHMKAVAEYLDRMRLPGEYDRELLKKAAFVHDILRTSKDHAKEGAEFLRKEGYDEIAALVREHHSSETARDGKGADICGISADELLFYADKRIQEDRVVSLEKRFETSLAKCNTKEARGKTSKIIQ